MDEVHHRSEDVDDARHEREWTALNIVLPALKPIEREVLFAYHPAGANRKGPQVAAELGITPGQARTHYMEALAVLKPLMTHVLAPRLSKEEANAVLDYTSGVMTNKRDRGRMKRHLQHCERCRALAASERAVVGAGARLVLPLPAILGAAKTWTAAGAAATAAGAATGAGLATTGTAGGGAVGLAKLAAGLAAAITAAGGGYVAVHEAARSPKRRHAAVIATATPATTSVAVFVTPTIAPATVTTSTGTALSRPTTNAEVEARARARRAQVRARRQAAMRRQARAGRHTSGTGTSPLAIPTVAPPAPVPTTVAAIPTAPPASPSTSSSQLRPAPPADRGNSKFSGEFTP